MTDNDKSNSGASSSFNITIINTTNGKNNQNNYSTELEVSVRSNLALVCNHLEMYETAEENCALALALIKKPQEDCNSSSKIRSDVVAKLFFRKAKSLEMRGLLKEAINDLNQCVMVLFEEEKSQSSSVGSKSMSNMKRTAYQ